MPPIPNEHRCLVCARREPLRGVVVDGRQILLCAEHHAALGEASEALSDLAGLMARPGLDRRSGRDRRRRERRMFPRPEGRRLGMGRRASDPDG